MIIWRRVRHLLRFALPHIAEKKATKWERRLRYTYIFFAFNALVTAFYLNHRIKQDPNYKASDKTRGERWAEMNKVKDVTFVKMKGISEMKVWKSEDKSDKVN